MIKNKKNIIDVPLEIGKIYEYICKWNRPLMVKPRGRYIAQWNNCLITHGDTFMIIEKLPRTISYIKVCVINTGRVGWLYTGFPNGYNTYSEEASGRNDSLSKVIKKLI